MKKISLLLLVSMLVWGGGVKVPMETDMIELTDGRVVKGTILCVGSRSVVILADDQEETYPRDRVKTITRGRKTAESTSYITGNVNGNEQIVGKGVYTPPASPKKKPAKPAAQAKNAGKAKTAKPAAGRSSAPSGKGTAGAIQNLLKNPSIQKELEKMKDSKKVSEFLKKNNILINNKEIQKALNNR